MKIYIAVFVFVVFASNICRAQVTMKSIPLLKESAKIDSLISSVIAPENLKGLKNGSCILLALNKTKYDAGFVQGIHAIIHKGIVYDYANFNHQKKLGYFEFRGYLIFVYGDSVMNKFFSYTKSRKQFTFIKPTPKQEIFTIHNFMSWALFYREGEFNYGVH